MRLEISFENPGNNVEFDDFLLNLPVDFPIFRIWESPRYFVVMGRSSPDSDVNWLNCTCDGVPILRRRSGGGVVLQGPGCLNYTILLSSNLPSYSTIRGAFESILKIIANNLTNLLPDEMDIELLGISDLCIDNRKFSGNAQRRRKNRFYVHGTILYDMDISLIERYLNMPANQPDYRKGRGHRDFVCNFPVRERSLIRDALIYAFSEIEKLVRTRGGL